MAKVTVASSLDVRSVKKSESEDLQFIASLIPNGPMLMNKTKMNASDLPEDSQHVNGKTVAADWHKEYPPFAVNDTAAGAEPRAVNTTGTAQSEARALGSSVPVVTALMLMTVGATLVGF